MSSPLLPPSRRRALRSVPMTDPAAMQATPSAVAAGAALGSGRVTIEVPAQAEFVAVLRAASAVLASRLDFSLDDIDDLRILIDEAASVLLASGATGMLRCEIDTTSGSDEVPGIRFWLRGRLPEGEDPHSEGFAWSILQALAHSVSIDKDDGDHVVSVTRRSGPVLDSTR